MSVSMSTTKNGKLEIQQIQKQFLETDQVYRKLKMQQTLQLPS